MPTYKVTNEDSIWYGSNVTRIQRVADVQDVVNAVGVGIGWLARASQNAEAKRLVAAISRAIEFLDNADYDKAFRIGEELSYYNADPETQAAGHFIMGKAQRNLGQWEEAVECQTKAIELAEQTDVLSIFPFPVIERAAAYLSMDEWRASLRDSTAFIRLRGDSDVGYYFQGLGLHRIGDLPQALKSLDKAVELDPSDSRNYRARSQVLADMKKFQAALDDLNRAVNLEPDCLDNYFDRAKVHASLGQHKQALADYDEAASLDSENYEIWKGRAESLRALGLTSQADEQLRTARKLESSHAMFENYVALADELYKVGFRTAYTDEEQKFPVNIVKSILYPIIAILVAGVIDLFALSGGSITFIGGLLAIFLFVREITKPRRQRREYEKYCAEIQEAEESKPRFGEFYVEYLAARSRAQMQMLEDETRLLFMGLDS